MSAWLLAAFFCARASAGVVETGGAIAPAPPVSGSIGAVVGAPLSPISVVPAASLLAPSLNTGTPLQAFPEQAAASLPAGAALLAPASIPASPAAEASAASEAPRQEASAETGASPRAVAADRRRGSDAADPAEGSSARLDAEGAAALGRKIFDRAADRASLADADAAPAGPPPARRAAGPAALAPDGGSADGEAMRDAIASPIAAAAAPGTAFAFFRAPGSPDAPSRIGMAVAAAPAAFERLSLELGSGLVVKFRAALGFASTAAAARPFEGAAQRTAAAAFSAPGRPRAPITSTEWLERRGLLETLSISEAAASQAAALIPPAASAPGAPAPRSASAAESVSAAAPQSVAAPALVLDKTSTPIRVPAPIWWIVAFLPAAFVLFKEFL